MEYTGQIVTLSWEDGEAVLACGLEDCDCPEHDLPPKPRGLYVTVRLDDEETALGLGRAVLRA